MYRQVEGAPCEWKHSDPNSVKELRWKQQERGVDLKNLVPNDPNLTERHARRLRTLNAQAGIQTVAVQAETRGRGSSGWEKLYNKFQFHYYNYSNKYYYIYIIVIVSFNPSKNAIFGRARSHNLIIILAGIKLFGNCWPLRRECEGNVLVTTGNVLVTLRLFFLEA